MVQAHLENTKFARMENLQAPAPTLCCPRAHESTELAQSGWCPPLPTVGDLSYHNCPGLGLVCVVRHSGSPLHCHFDPDSAPSTPPRP
jgi:hypothetical protein